MKFWEQLLFASLGLCIEVDGQGGRANRRQKPAPPPIQAPLLGSTAAAREEIRTKSLSSSLTHATHSAHSNPRSQPRRLPLALQGPAVDLPPPRGLANTPPPSRVTSCGILATARCPSPSRAVHRPRPHGSPNDPNRVRGNCGSPLLRSPPGPAPRRGPVACLPAVCRPGGSCAPLSPGWPCAGLTLAPSRMVLLPSVAPPACPASSQSNPCCAAALGGGGCGPPPT